MPHVAYRYDPSLGPSDLLRHVYWIGGGSAAGKSTIARRIAAAHGLQLYSTDDAMADHAKQSTPVDCPLLHEFMAMDMDARWLNRSPKDLLEIGKTSNPERALRNLLERDAMFTQGLYEEAQRLELNTIQVDSTMTVDDLTGRVAEALRL